MTVFSTQARDEGYAQYDANGKQTYFEYGFTLLPGDTIAVFLKDKRLDPSQYTQSSKGITMKDAPVGRLVIVRALEITQTRNFSAFDSFNAEWTETAMDKLILLKQEAAEFRAFMNITAIHNTSNVRITNDKGTDAIIYLWDGRNDEDYPPPPPVIPPDPANPEPESGLSDDFTQFDYIVDWQTVPAPPLNQGTIDILVYPNGQLDVWAYNTTGAGNSYTNFPQVWNEAAPLVDDPENYESRLTWISGWRYLYYRNPQNTAWVLFATAGATGVDSSPWQNLGNQNTYRYFHRDDSNFSDTLIDKPCTCQLEIREVGKPETVKIKSMDLRLLIQT